MAFAFLLISSPVYGNKDSDYYLISTEKRENSRCHFPFQFIFFISLKVSVHHSLPGLISYSNVWFHSLVILMTSVVHNKLW